MSQKESFLNSISYWKNAELKKQLKKQHLSPSGNKAQLVQRLQNFHRNPDQQDLSNTGTPTDERQRNLPDDESAGATCADYYDDATKQQMELEQLELKLKILQTQDQIRTVQHRLSKDPEDLASQHTSSHTSDVTEMLKLVKKSVEVNGLPPAELTIFDGNVLEYPSWKATFDLLIDEKDIAPQHKLVYLKKYLSGKALACVKSYFFLTTDDAYSEVRELLEERFGDPGIMADTFRDRLETWPRIPLNDGERLRQYADFLKQSKLAKRTIPELDKLDDQREMKNFVNALPMNLLKGWSRYAGKHKRSHKQYPSFSDYAEFVEEEAYLACDSNTSMSALTPSKNVQQKSAQPRSVGTKYTVSHNTNTEIDVHKTCFMCVYANSHPTIECRRIARMTNLDRQKFMIQNRLCFKCLMKGHSSADCRTTTKCKDCNGDHATCLHGNKKPEFTSTEKPATAATGVISNKVNAAPNANVSNTKLTSMILPVYVSTQEDPGTETLVYALIDTQSDTSFITTDVSNSLFCKKVRSRLNISTITSDMKVVSCERIINLRVRGMRSTTKISVPEVYTQEAIPANREHIPTPETAASWDHLKHIQNRLSPLQHCDIALLIGYNCSAALTPLNMVKSDLTLPYAVETILGWSIIGGKNCATNALCTSHRITSKELTNDQILKCLEEDMEVCHDQPLISQDDLLFLKKMERSITQVEGFYSMPLPFKQRPDLPDNRAYAMKRFQYLARRLESNSELNRKYRDFMTEIISSGEAEVVSNSTSKGWYIPHHGVFHPLKPGKLRVVFDCSSTFRGESLNKHLLQGLDLNSSLTGLICRFRKEKVAVTCDIKKMFHQFRVSKEDRDYLRFLWFDSESNIIDYHMNVHLFGAMSSPSCAIFGLKRIAKDIAMEFPAAAAFIQDNFYVDDGLMSMPTSCEVIKMIEDAKELCSRGNLILHKFISNDSAVAKALGCEGPTTKDLDSDQSVCRTLGLVWDVNSDEYRFLIKEIDKPTTRRGVLATIASVFDPLGFVTPFILQGKLILQDLCNDGKKWDDPLSVEQLNSWKSWLSNLNSITAVRIRRCFLTSKLTETSMVELHTFSDASSYAYGVCAYLRLIDLSTKTVSLTLVLGKSRVAPSKRAMTIPRLELQAAVLAVRVSDFVCKELKYDNISTYFWTDSQSILGYISNEAKRFHVFVCNRVQRIKDSTATSQWNYISTMENPADVASRGSSIKNMPTSWLEGPEFLLDQAYTCKGQPKRNFEIDQEDPEIKKVFTRLTQTDINDKEQLLMCFNRYSSWSIITRVVCRILKLTQKNITPFSDAVFFAIIKLLQSVHFAEEIDLLKAQREVRKTSSLYKLDPFVDGSDILRVGGRLVNSMSDYEVCHPAVLPSKAHITTVFIRHKHVQVAHQGRMTTLNAIRSSGVHLASQGMRAVSATIFHCVKCRRLRGDVSSQKMADLPKARVTPAAPFTYTGTDVFGPFIVKQGRKEVKRYGLIFTCLSSRAVHIELLEDLSTDNFINSLRCMLAIRGSVRLLCCDQGTNFVGADNEFKKLMKEMTGEKVERYLQSQQCCFKFNPPSASHMGGSWERMIRTIRAVMNGLLIERNTSRLNTTELRTLFYECMNIINNRPLTTQQLEQTTSIEPLPLTPNMLLTMKESPALPPPGTFEETDMYAKKRWRRVQYLTEQFWARWKVEYLQSLQTRQKWNRKQIDYQIGDIVLIKDENSVRGDWKLGRVEETHASGDNLVREVTLRVGNGQRLNRPIHKLVLLLPSQ